MPASCTGIAEVPAAALRQASARHPGGPERVAGQRAGSGSHDTNRSAQLEALLALEERLRRATDIARLRFEVVNGLRPILPLRQVMILRRARRGRGAAAWRMEAVTGLSRIDPHASAPRWLARQFGPLALDAEGVAGLELTPTDLPEDVSLPFRHAHVAPLRDRAGRSFGALAGLGERPLTEGEAAVLTRVAEALSHAWVCLQPRPLRGRVFVPGRVAAGALTLAAGLAMLVPVPMTVLAPAEIVAREPFLVAAPMDGVVEEVLVEPNRPVDAGTVLFRFVDTDLSARLQVARRERDVAEARLRTARQNAFGDGRGMRDLAVARAELDLAQAELDHAAARARKAVVRAPRAGLAIFERRADWQGRPVSMGERVIELADPANVTLRVDLPPSDAIRLQTGARVRLFADADPLAPLEGSVERVSYRASKAPDGTLVFPVRAGLRSANAVPRIGTRGTAQLFGERVRLGYFLFRKPMAAVRQWIGR